MSSPLTTLSLAFVEQCYEILLSRAIDSGAKIQWTNRLIAASAIDHWTTVQTLLHSAEFRQVHDSIDRTQRDKKMHALLELLAPYNLTKSQWVQTVFHLQLNRAPCEAEIQMALPKRWWARHAWKEHVLNHLRGSPEFAMAYQRPLPIMRVHSARQAWVAELPQAQTLLDIGGSSPYAVEGTLLDMGYPHRPKRLTIFDKPPESQYFGKPGYDQSQTYALPWGEVQFLHGFAEDIVSDQRLIDAQFDLIFMGQVVEHVLPQALPGLFQWISTHLSPHGTFCCDTPNRLITRLQTGEDDLIDPDHKYEYRPSELQSIMQDNGLRVIKQVGLLEMPNVVSLQRFGTQDYYQGRLICENPNDGYCFASHCVAR
jgi:SAM-dependent methyltransferase